MATHTTYTYSISQDMPNGVLLHPDALQAYLMATSSITISLAFISTSGDNLNIQYNDVLDTSSRIALDGNDGSGGINGAPTATHPAGGALAAYIDTPVVQPAITTTIVPAVGGLGTRVDGGYIIAAANQCKRLDYIVPEPMHIQGTNIQWMNMQPGDKGEMIVIHPGGIGHITANVSAGDTEVDVGALAPYFTPSISGAQAIEFWSADWSTVIEVVEIQGASNTTITVPALNNGHTTSENIRVRVGRFVTIRGANGIDGGFYLLGTGSELIRNEADISDLLPTGLVISVILWTSSATADRALAINFVMRTPTV